MTSYYTSAATTSSSADTSGYTADTSFSSGESSGGWQLSLESYQEFMDPTLYFTLAVTGQSGHGWTLYDGTNDVYDMNVVSYTIEGTDYALATYLDTMSNTAYAYVLYYANNNPYKISYEIADTSAITAIYYNENGDVIIKTVDMDGGTDYTTITSGYDYNFAPVLTTGLSGAIDSNGIYAIDPASLGTDADGDALSIASYSADTADIAMAVDSSGNLFAIYTGTLAQGANRLVTISYGLSDGTNTTSGGSIAVTVTGNGSSNLELTYDQYVALAAAGYDSTDFDAAFDQITVSCTAAEFEAEIGLNPQTASSLGVTDVTISDGSSVTLSYYAAGFLAVNEVTIAGASDVKVDLAAEDIAGFETEDANANPLFSTLFGYYAALGVTKLVLADGNDIQLSLAPYTALANNGIAISATGTVTLADSAADIAAMSATDVANMAAVGVGHIDATDNNLALSAGLAAKLAAAGLVFAEADTVSVTGSLAAVTALIAASGDAMSALNIDSMNVEDLATTIKALSVAEIAALGDAGVTGIDLLDDAVTLAASQIAAFSAAGIDFAADDVITEKAVPVAVADS
ncbi:hypothetical protein, partial [Rhizobium alvei]